MRNQLLGFLAGAATLLAAGSASAQTVYDWPSDKVPVAIHDGGSVFFIGKDKSVWRVYKWSAPKGKDAPAAFFTDINGDGKADVVGAGKPSFALDHDSNPIWFNASGCDQLLVANTWEDSKPEMVCLKGKTLKNYTWNWQEIWSVSIGKSWSSCHAGDINGDVKADIECKIRGSKNFSRVDGATAEMLAGETDTSELDSTADVNISPAEKILDGSKEFDLDGDGTAEESLVIDGNAVAIKSRSKKVALGRLDLGAVPVGAVVKDIDGDKKLDVVAVSAKQVAIWTNGDKEAKSFALSSSKYKRTPVADLESVYANGFEDDAAAKKVVEDLGDKLAACYAAQVKKNQFAGVGRALLEVQVDNAGKAKNVQKHHAELADNKVVACAQKVLKGGKYPKAGGDSASVNVTLTFTFRDK